MLRIITNGRVNQFPLAESLNSRMLHIFAILLLLVVWHRVGALMEPVVTPTISKRAR